MNKICLPKTPFSAENVLKLIKKDKILEAKKYISKYYFKINHPVCCYFYDVLTNKMLSFTYKEIDDAKLAPFTYSVNVNGKKYDCSLATWFLKQDIVTYNLILKVNAPKVYSENGQNYINLFNGFKWENERQSTEEEKEGIKIVWDHVYNILCSKNDKAFNLLKKLVCLTIAGQKSKIIIYFRSQEGTGKGIFTNFIMDRVLGSKICHSTGKTLCLGQFNGELMGKILLSFQELRCSNSEAWATMNEELKYLATEPYIDINEKCKTSINLENIISIWISSNNNNIKISKNDRRFLVLDVSNEKIGNTEYFNSIAKYTDSETFAEAFYWDAVNFAKPFLGKEFEGELRDIVTETKKELVLKGIHPLYEYIKNEYVLKQRPFKIFLSDLVKDYNNSDVKNELKNIDISRLLKEINITGKPSTGNKLKFQIEWDELLEIFKKNNFMHELDEFNDPNEENIFDGYHVKKIKNIK